MVSRLERGRIDRQCRSGASARSPKPSMRRCRRRSVARRSARPPDGRGAMRTLVGETVERLQSLGWSVSARGFLLGVRRARLDRPACLARRRRARCSCRVKTELTSIEETLRRHDAKVRLAPRIARERFGWDPAVIARLLVLPEDRTARRRIEEHRATFRRRVSARERSGEAVVVSTRKARWLASCSCQIRTADSCSAAGHSKRARRSLAWSGRIADSSRLTLVHGAGFGREPAHQHDPWS